MGFRLFLLVLLAGGAMLNPSLRARVKPHVWPRVEPHVRTVLDPVYEWSANSRVEEIGRQLRTEVTQGAGLPEPQRFEGYLRARYHGPDGAQDPWGTPYQLVRAADEAWVVSAGRDRTVSTADDIRSAGIRARR